MYLGYVSIVLLWPETSESDHLIVYVPPEADQKWHCVSDYDGW